MKRPIPYVFVSVRKTLLIFPQDYRFYYVKSLLVLQNFSTARRSGNISSHTEKLFSDSDRKVIQ